MPNIYFKVSRIVQSCLTHCDIYSDLSRNPCERRRTTRQHNVYVQLELNTSYISVDVKKKKNPRACVLFSSYIFLT